MMVSTIGCNGCNDVIAGLCRDGGVTHHTSITNAINHEWSGSGACALASIWHACERHDISMSCAPHLHAAIAHAEPVH